MVKRKRPTNSSQPAEVEKKKFKVPILPIKEEPESASENEMDERRVPDCNLITRELRVKVERLDPAKFSVAPDAAAELEPAMKEELCLFCAATFSPADDAQDLGQQRRATMEFVLGTTLVESPETCSSCWRMFELYDCFKRSCLAALSSQREMAASFKDDEDELENDPLNFCSTTQRSMEDFNDDALGGMLEAESDTPIPSPPKKRKVTRKLPKEAALSPLSTEKSFQCTKCRRLFVAISGLLAHKRSCTGSPKPAHGQAQPQPLKKLFPPKLVCKKCEIRFPTAELAKAHATKQHSRRLKQLRCPHCPEVFHKKPLYENHINMHQGNRPYPCRVDGCTKTFCGFKTRRRHERLVHGDKKECDICGAKVSAGAFWAHTVSHREGQHVCDVCDKKFTSTTMLRNHKVSHQVERNFECQHCGKKFKSNKYLLRHTAVVHKNSRAAPNSQPSES